MGRERGRRLPVCCRLNGGRLDRLLFPFWLPALFRTVVLQRRGSGVGKGLAYSDDTEEYRRRRAFCLSSREWWVEWPLSSFLCRTGGGEKGAAYGLLRMLLPCARQGEQDGGRLLFRS